MARRSGEDGFSLPELLLAMAILAMVVAAVFGVYQVSQQTYIRATSLEDAQLSARAGLERMVSDLQLIGAYSWTGTTGSGGAILAATPTGIAFMADIDADTVAGGQETTTAGIVKLGDTNVSVQLPMGGSIGAFSANESLYIADGSIREVHQIASVSGNNITVAPSMLNTSDYPPGSIVRSVETVTYAYDAPARTITRTVGGNGPEIIVDNVTGFILTYFDGFNPSVETAILNEIREIRIALTTRGGDGSSRTMTVLVRPRTLSP